MQADDFECLEKRYETSKCRGLMEGREMLLFSSCNLYFRIARIGKEKRFTSIKARTVGHFFETRGRVRDNARSKKMEGISFWILTKKNVEGDRWKRFLHSLRWIFDLTIVIKYCRRCLCVFDVCGKLVF